MCAVAAYFELRAVGGGAVSDPEACIADAEFQVGPGKCEGRVRQRNEMAELSAARRGRVTSYHAAAADCERRPVVELETVVAVDGGAGLRDLCQRR